MTSEPQILILKFLQGTLSPAEKAELFEWTQASEVNRKELEAHSEVWKITAKAPEKAFSTDEGWNELSGKLKGFQHVSVKERPAGKQFYQKHPWLVGMAATISLIFILFFAYSAVIRSVENLEIIASSVGEVKEVALPDGSTVWLNGTSKISFIKRFDSNARTVSLEGEAFFRVAPDEQKPFIVKTGKVNTQVLGTSFNLKSRVEDEKIEIVVFSGKVEFYEVENQSNKVLLTAGMKGVYLSEKDSILSEVNTDPNVISWQSNTLIFKDTPVKEVLEVLNSRFNVEISASEISINSCKFTSTFKQASLKEILNVLVLSLDLKYTQKGDKYILTGTGCY